MESAVCRIHIVCFIYSLFLLFALPPFLLLHAVSEGGVGRGDVKGYRAAISEMETWHFLSLSPLTLYPVRYSTHEGTPGTGMEGKGGGRRKPPKLAYTAGRSLCQ